MDDGVGNYVYYSALRKSASGADVEAWHKAQLNLVREALAAGKWLKIADITYLYDWNLAESASPGLAPAEAYAVVSFMVETYGLERCIKVYETVSHNGGSAESGMASILGLTFEQLEAGVRGWLEAQTR
jgi:hypothetical protein